MVKITFDSKEKVHEEFKDQAEEKDGKWIVDLSLTSKVTEFRDNNIKISKERDDLKVSNDALLKVTGDDPVAFAEEISELRGIKQQVADGKIKGSAEIEKQVDARVKGVTESFEKQLAERATEVADWKGKFENSEVKYRGTKIDSDVTAAAGDEKLGVLPSAIPDLVSRARKVFQVTENGSLVAKEGDTVIYGPDGTTSITPLEWLGNLKETAPHFFKNSTGGGASGAKNGPVEGYTSEEFQKLDPVERIKLHRKRTG